MTLELGVVMPCHNRVEALRLTLDSLSRQACAAQLFEVTVVDQASTDGSRELVRAFSAPYELRLIEQDAKYGISVARNAGIEAASTPLVLLLDADLIPDPGLVAAHMDLHRAHPGALVCGRVLPCPSAYRTFVERAADPDAALDRGGAEGAISFHSAFGGHMSFSAATFRRVGPFDPLLHGFEDIDFAYRAQRLSVPIVSCPAAVAYHNHPRSLEQRLEQARSYNRMWPELLGRYPELRGTVPGLRDFEPVNWRDDHGRQILAKARIRLLAAGPVRGALAATLSVLERAQMLPRVAKALYWRLLQANWHIGVREGSRR